jgi:hypothetical protein
LKASCGAYAQRQEDVEDEDSPASPTAQRAGLGDFFGRLAPRGDPGEEVEVEVGALCHPFPGC